MHCECVRGVWGGCERAATSKHVEARVRRWRKGGEVRMLWTHKVIPSHYHAHALHTHKHRYPRKQKRRKQLPRLLLARG